MIGRYETKEMKDIWSEEAKFTRWSWVECAACEVMHKRGQISDEEIKQIRSAKPPAPERVLEIEKETDHDVVAFLRAYGENIGPASKYVHRGLTSSDVCDTALAIALRNSGDIICDALFELSELLKEKALTHKNLPCIGRTHGVHAEPSVFGLKFLGWYAECERNADRFIRALYSIKHGKLSGAVGNYSQHDPEFERDVLELLHLDVEPISTQVVPRDRHAELLSSLALIGGMIERIALEIRCLQRTEVGEVGEGFKKGQTGSSAMPHKRNPIMSEKLCGMSRLLRGYMIAAHEDMALWHERDISHSSVERVILPDAFHVAHYMLKKCTALIQNLAIFGDKISDNINLTKGLVFSQNILDLLLSKGLDRTTAYKIVQKSAFEVLSYDNELHECVSHYSYENGVHVDPDEVLEVMDENKYLTHIDAIYKTVFNAYKE